MSAWPEFTAEESLFRWVEDDAIHPETNRVIPGAVPVRAWTSVDRGEICEAEDTRCRPSAPPTAGVISVTVTSVNDFRWEAVPSNPKQPTHVFTLLPVSDPNPKEDPSNDAHALLKVLKDGTIRAEDAKVKRNLKHQIREQLWKDAKVEIAPTVGS